MASQRNYVELLGKVNYVNRSINGQIDLIILTQRAYRASDGTTTIEETRHECVIPPLIAKKYGSITKNDNIHLQGFIRTMRRLDEASFHNVIVAKAIAQPEGIFITE